MPYLQYQRKDMRFSQYKPAFSSISQSMRYFWSSTDSSFILIHLRRFFRLSLFSPVGCVVCFLLYAICFWIEINCFNNILQNTFHGRTLENILKIKHSKRHTLDINITPKSVCRKNCICKWIFNRELYDNPAKHVKKKSLWNTKNSDLDGFPSYQI